MKRVLQDVHLSGGGGETVLSTMLSGRPAFVTVGVGDAQAVASDVGPNHQVLIDSRRLGADLLNVLRDPNLLPLAQKHVPRELDVVMHHHFGLALAGSSHCRAAYLHTPTRVLWEQERVPWEANAIHPLLRDWMYSQEMECIASTRRVYVNSRATRDRTWTAYGVEAHVLYPPIKSGDLGLDVHRATSFGNTLPKQFALTVGRIAPGKQILEAIQYAHRLPLPWVIAGSGRLADDLMASLPPNTVYLGRVSEFEKYGLIDAASVCIGTSREDFGLFVAESIARGRPTVAEEGSGALELADERNCASYRNASEDEGQSLQDAIASVLHKRGTTGHAESVRALLDPGLFARTLMS